MRFRATRSLRMLPALVVLLGIVLGGCETEEPRKKPKRTEEQAAKGVPAPKRQPSESWKEPGNYLGAVTHSKTFAETRKCQTRLKTLMKELDMYHAVNGQFPPSLAAVNRSDLTRCPYRRGGPYRYVPGQSKTSPAGSILVYEADAPHEGKAHAMLVDGTVVSLTPEQLQERLAATRGGGR